MWLDLQKVPFSHTKFGPFLNFVRLHNFVIVVYNGLQFSMHKPTVFGYILTQKVTLPLKEVPCYSDLYADI